MHPDIGFSTWGIGARLRARMIARRALGRCMPHLPFASRLCEANRRGHVVMIHVGRSGSTVLGNLLNQHRQIAWDGEIYQRIFDEREFADQSLPPITNVDAVSYVTKRARSVFGRYYGFEVKFYHLRVLGTQLAPYLDALDERFPNARFIVLERKNTLRMVVSTLAARATGVWHLGPGPGARRNRLRLDVDAVFVNRTHSGLVEILREFERDFSDLAGLLEKRPSLHLTYEEDVMDDPRRAYAKVCRHLDLPPGEARVQFSRTNPYPLTELIENFDEVASALSGTGFEWMLENG